MHTYNMNVAATPKEPTRSAGMRLKQAALASCIVLSPHIAGRKGGLMAFGVATLVVPPPFGVLTGVLAAVAYNSGAAAGHKLVRATHNKLGIAHPRDFEVLEEFNRRQRQAHRLVLPLERHPYPARPGPRQKTVFPVAEMR